MGASRRWDVRHLLWAAAALSLFGIGVGAYTAYDWFWGGEAAFRAAQAAVKRHDFVTADREVKRCLAANPRKAEAHLLAAQIIRRSLEPYFEDEDDSLESSGPSAGQSSVGSYEEAAAHLKEYERLGGFPELIKLERLLTLAQRGDKDVLEGPLKDIDTEHLYAVLVFEALAKGYMLDYRLADAEKYLEKLLKIEESPRALVQRGWMAFRGQDYDKALHCYQRVLDIDPDNDDARIQLAIFDRMSSKPLKALEHFEHVHSRRPENRTAAYGVAEALLELGRVAEARQTLQPLLDEDPGNVELLFLLAKIEFREGDFKKAETLTRKVLKKKPLNRDANLLLSQCLGRGDKKANQKEQSFIVALLDGIEHENYRLDEVTRKMVTDQKDANLRWEAGAILIGNGHPKGGLHWLRQALKLDPQHADSLELLEVVKKNQGRITPELIQTAHRQLKKFYGSRKEPRFEALAEYHSQAAKLYGADVPVTAAQPPAAAPRPAGQQPAAPAGRSSEQQAVR